MAAEGAPSGRAADGVAALAEPLRKRLRRGALAALTAVIALYVFRRFRVDLRFPVPWPDESSFLWQALAFRDHWWLLAPEVNPDREVLWMPPGFMLLEGLFFKIVPFSLNASRTLSTLFIGGAVACVRASLRRFEAKSLFPVLAALFLFCPIALMTGNVARMEGLELLVLAGAFLLLERRHGAGLGLLVVAPIVHPNGLFGLAAGAVYVAIGFRNRPQFRRADVLVLAFAALAWMLYGSHIAHNWAGFATDMEAQLRFKRYVSAGDGGALARVVEPVIVGAALALGAAAIYEWRRGRSLGGLVAFGAALLLQSVVAAGWLYDIYPAFAVLVASVVAVEAVTDAASTSAWPLARQKGAAGAAVALLLAFDAIAFYKSPFLQRSLDRSTVERPSRSPSYLTRGDHAALVSYLTSITPSPGSPPLSVQFLPDAEALLYEDLRGPTLRYVQQTFYDHHYDVLVLHESVWFSPFMHDLELLKLLYSKKGPHETELIRERNGTERWIAYRWRQ